MRNKFHPVGRIARAGDGVVMALRRPAGAHRYNAEQKAPLHPCAPWHPKAPHMAIYRLGEHRPQIHPSAYVHESAVIIGHVTLGARCSVWPGAVLRADNAAIVVGDETNIQDNCVIHADPGMPVHIGSGATIGHQAMLHGCTIGDGTLIGIQAVVLNECIVGRNSLVGACALLPERRHIADGSMALGAPAKVLRALTIPEIDGLAEVAQSYVRRAALFQTELERLA